jgi:peptidoglycan hydrolase-like protein with peptidoglycan-binding domain
MLNNAHASPGAIDGMSGKNTLKAISSFQQMNGFFKSASEIVYSINAGFVCLATNASQVSLVNSPVGG